MKDKTITRKIIQGMYILTTIGGGCCVDAVSQVSSGANPLFAVAVMKNNYTNKLMKKNDKFAISILGMNVSSDIIKTFGFNSMRTYDKFENTKTIEVDGIKIVEDSLGYLLLEKIDQFENETHTVFIGKLIEADKFSDVEPMSYQYYQEHKNELLKIETEKGKTAWICTVCGYVYYGETFKDDFKCPICGVTKEYFIVKKD